MATLIKIKLLCPQAKFPERKTDGAAGYDLYSAEKVRINSFTGKLIRTGISIELPRGFEGQIRSRSGLAVKNNLFVLNSPGTIDSDYRGEICVLLYNAHQDTPYIVEIGERIAQIVFSKVEEVKFTQAESLNETDRGIFGFGSTGK